MLKAHDYIKCYQNSFWTWDRSGGYIRLKEGNTFAHWEEVKKHVQNLAPSGLPLFDVYLGLLAATRPDEFGLTGELICKALEPSVPIDMLFDRYSIFNTMHQVDRKFKEEGNSFLMVAALIDKVNVKLIESVSAKIANELVEKDMELYGAQGEMAQVHYKKVARCFRYLSDVFPDPQSIVEAMTGFNRDDFELGALIPQSTSKENDTSQTLLDELRADVRTEKMAALIPYVISGLNFPIHASQSDERPEGGVSDLSNKGHFDQLIVTEHAYDDDYFLSRIVNSEAFFYHREKAKNENNETVCVLIDASLYMWGIPKMVATAIGCSIGIKEEKSEVHYFMVGSELVPCNFSSLDGVLKGIRYTDASICPVEGLETFVETENTFSNTLFVTTPQSWKRQEMYSFRESAKQLLDFIIFTNENAEINVLKSKGKQLAQFKLDLKSIWEIKQKDLPRSSNELTSVYPILFPISNGRIKYYFGYMDDVFYVDKSNRLFLIHKAVETLEKGARFILRIESHFSVLGDIGKNQNGEYELLMFNPKSKEALIYNLKYLSEKRFFLPQWKAGKSGVFFYVNNHFHYIQRDGQWTFDEHFSATTPLVMLDPNVYRAAQSRLQSIRVKSNFTQNYFKSTREIVITDQSELVIQNRKLEARADGILFSNFPAGNTSIRSRRTKTGEITTYSFNSGEKVIMNPSGMMEFQFNDKYEAKAYQLNLVAVGSEKITTVKIISNYLGRGLKDAKMLVDEGRGVIMTSHDKDNLNRMANHLQGAGNKAEVKAVSLRKKFYMPSSDSHQATMASECYFAGNRMFKDEGLALTQEEISPFEFYDLYVRTFIQNVKNGI